MGTAAIACPSLESLTHLPSLEVCAVFTQPDRAQGRNLKIQATPVKIMAGKLGLEIHQPQKLREHESIGLIQSLQPALIVVVAYGQILPQAVLEIPHHGCLNVHTSLLPKYRGAAPIQWALLNGEEKTGVTLMKMNAGLDTGPVLSQEETTILPGDNAVTLHDRLGGIGASLLKKIIPEYINGKINPISQSEAGASYARKITREDGRLDWQKPARQLRNQVRGLVPWPGTYFYFQSLKASPRLIKVWKAEVIEGLPAAPGALLQANEEGLVVGTGEGGLRILELQPEGGNRLSAGAYLRGHPVQNGDLISNG